MDGESGWHDMFESILHDQSSEPCNLPLEYLRKITNDFDDKQLIGEGCFGKVYKGLLQNEKLIAVKKLDQIKPGVQEKQFENEVYHLMRLKHPNIVQFLGYCYETKNECLDFNGKYIFAEKQHRLLCLEYLSNGSLDMHLSDESSGFDWDTRYKIIKGVCCGVHYLHEECPCQINGSIIHLDLKPSNILLDDNMVPKVADFGLSRHFDDKKTQTHTNNLAGSLGYMAPEYICSHLITRKADIYGLGAIIIEIITGKRIDPFSFNTVTSYHDFVEAVLRNWSNRLKEAPSETDLKQIKCCLEIGLSCVKVNQNERPTTKKIIDSLNRGQGMNCYVNNEDRQPTDKDHKYQDLFHKHSNSSIYEMDLPENKLREFIYDNDKPMWTAHTNHNLRCFKEDDIRTITKNYGTLIGKGAFGEVYLGALDDNGLVAVKRYVNNLKEEFAKEVIAHCQVNHRNVVRLIGYCIGESALMMVTEYISQGNLSDILHSSEISISLETRLGIAIGCAEALSYMHSQMYGQVIHGDFKPANILLDENFNAKISDFGLSTLLSTDITLYTTNVIGSIGYMDPLFAHSGRLTSKSDVYSFGVVLLELITRRKPYGCSGNIVEKIVKAQAKPKKIREFFDKEIAHGSNLRILDRIGKLAAECLHVDIDKRPEMKDVAERLRILRKEQYQAREKITLFHWVLRRKPAAQNAIHIDKMGEINVISEYKMGEVSLMNRSFGPLQKTELDEVLRASPQVLGKGKYGTTYKANLENGSVLTVKRANGEVVPESVFKERIGAIAAIEHELIVPLRGYYFSSDEQLLLYDYLGNGSLFSNLHGRYLGSRINNEKSISWESRAAIALSTARAVAYIHLSNSTASHGTIKSSNILLTESYEARVSEHGINTLVSTPASKISYCTAPEVVDLQNVSQKADVYSFGILLLELLTGKSPMPIGVYDKGTDLLRWIGVLAAKELQEALDQELLADDSVVEEMLQFFHLAIHCCNQDPDMRPVMSEVAWQIEEIRSSSTGAGRPKRNNLSGKEPEKTISSVITRQC